MRLGDRIADYEVIGMLGAGGMGAVYQVRHLISDRIEAMKVLLPDLESTPELGERFVREIRLQASMNHPNIASLHNALRVENQLLMIMEFVEGQTLAEIVRRGPIRPLSAIEVMTQALSALDYAHSRGVVHRDVKPSNIILTSQGVVKLMDFGIARGLDDFGALTQAGAAIGSMYYMAPEQVTGGKVDGRSDVYAAAVTLYEILTGERPIKGKTAAEVMEGQLHQQPVSPKLLSPAISDDLARIIMRALEKLPVNRYQSAGDFREELLKVQSTLSDPSETAPMASLKPIRDRLPGVPTPTPLTAGTRSQPPSSIPAQFDPQGLERVRKELAQHIGPVAKMLVDRAAKRARNWNELYAALAPEIPAGKDRDRFLAGCPRF
ncbi:MAG TPA: serine/threonine-protein kinase [Bryobacteraceae bacterium]|nr:serine/threonine-protein kinase [Bryobacteraceae bacterium]